MKKTTSQESDSSDENKLLDIKNQLRYRHAVFIKIKTDSEPKIVTIKFILILL